MGAAASHRLGYTDSALPLTEVGFTLQAAKLLALRISKMTSLSSPIESLDFT